MSPERPAEFSLPNRGSIYGEEEFAAIEEVIRSGAPLSSGAWQIQFEAAFRAYLGGAPYAISVTNCTTALHLAVRLLDLQPGDEVIASPQTYQATIQPLLDHGIHVRFCDVEPDTLNLDPERLPALITLRTRAIFVVHYAGGAANMQRIMQIADAHRLRVVEDAAHAIGGSYQGRPLGSFGHFACFSFHNTKNISTLGEGGMLVMKDEDAWQRASYLRGNRVDAVCVPARNTFGGLDRPAPGALFPQNAYTEDCVRVRGSGLNAILPEPSCAVGLAQLRRLPQLMARRRALCHLYAERLRTVPGVHVPERSLDLGHAHHFFNVFVDPHVIDRDAALRHIHANGIPLAIRYFPLHLLPEWRSRGHREGECPVTERRWFREQINIPCQPILTDADADHLLDVVVQGLRTATRSRAAAARLSSPQPPGEA